MKLGEPFRIPVVIILACCVIGCSGSPEDASDGGLVFQIDFAAGTERSIDRWEIMYSSEPARADLIDFATGQTTSVSITAANFSGSHESPENWPDDVDWLPVVVARDAWTQGLAETTPATVTFGQLEGDYRVEVVAAEGIQAFEQSITVNGNTTTRTFQGAIVDSSSWSPLTDGTDQTDWLVWPTVSPVNGQIMIEQRPRWNL